MRWRRPWPERQARPQAGTLTGDQQKKLLGTMTREIAASPVLTGLDLQVRTRRGRFYLERRYAAGGVEVTLSWGRITPLADPPSLLLEQERGTGLWSKIAQGSGRKLMKLIAGGRYTDWARLTKPSEPQARGSCGFRSSGKEG
jgi:hypothetical protein